MVYEESFSFKKEAFDENGNIYPFFILDIFEKAATSHGELLDVGKSKMDEKNLFWVVSQTKYQVLKKINSLEELVIKTWPLKPNRLNYQREYAVYNSKNEEVIIGSSNWLVMDKKERKLVIGADIFPPMEYSDKVLFTDKVRRLRDFPNGEFIKEITPQSEHIDLNGHVNNKHYTSFILSALSSLKGNLDTFQIDYVSEIMPQDKISLFVAYEDNITLIKGQSDKINFISKINYR